MVFKLNVTDYPQSANAYDSLAEAYMTGGDKELAIRNYRRSVELNPGNTNAVEMLKKLEGEIIRPCRRLRCPHFRRLGNPPLCVDFSEERKGII